MEASIFVRKPNTAEYTALGPKDFSVQPRADEFVSVDYEGKTTFFQVIAVHHDVNKKTSLEIYCVQTEPPWKVKKARAIGFGS